MIQDLIGIVAQYALWIAVASILSLVVASLLAAWLVARLPADYFTFRERHPDNEHWLRRLVLVSVKNVIGGLLIVAGVAMLLTPGQGLLTIVAGLLLTDFPGKFAMERKMARIPKVMGVLNWLRAKRGQPPFEAPD